MRIILRGAFGDFFSGPRLAALNTAEIRASLYPLAINEFLF